MRFESICPACGRSFKNSHVELLTFCSVGCQIDSEGCPHGIRKGFEKQCHECYPDLRHQTEEDGTTEVAQLRRLLRMAEERAAIATRERDEAVALNQAMSRVLQEYQDGYVYCEKHGHEQQEPCPQCAEEDR